MEGGRLVEGPALLLPLQVVMGWHHEGEEDGLDMERRRQNPSRCDHSYPALVNTTETGSHYARCLGCLTIGPERSSSMAARQGLKDLGAHNGSATSIARLHRTPSEGGVMRGSRVS
jgi:hypothetical protein